MSVLLRNRIWHALLIFAIALLVGCDSESTERLRKKFTEPPPLRSPEMPGDRFGRLVHWQSTNVGQFSGHRFVLERDGLTPVEAIATVFEEAGNTPHIFSRTKLESIPELVFEDSLTSKWFPSDVSIAFGLFTYNSYPEYTVSEMIANLCLDHDIELLECNESRYRFGLAAPSEPEIHEAIERGKNAGLELHAELPTKRGRYYRVTITNHGTEKIQLIMPGDGSRNDKRTPFVVWSVLPADDPTITHPSPRCRDRFMPGCGLRNELSPDEIKEIEPGETLDVGPWVSRLWEYGSGEVAGNFRAKLYYRIDTNHYSLNYTSPHAAEPAKTVAAEMRQSLDCLLISNEITFTATDWMGENRRQREEYEKTKLQKSATD